MFYVIMGAHFHVFVYIATFNRNKLTQMRWCHLVSEVSVHHYMLAAPCWNQIRWWLSTEFLFACMWTLVIEIILIFRSHNHGRTMTHEEWDGVHRLEEIFPAFILATHGHTMAHGGTWYVLDDWSDPTLPQEYWSPRFSPSSLEYRHPAGRIHLENGSRAPIVPIGVDRRDGCHRHHRK